MLKQGCTKKSVKLLKMVDVDLEDVSTYDNAIKWMENLAESLKKIEKNKFFLQKTLDKVDII